jgi:hypothetical protein
MHSKRTRLTIGVLVVLSAAALTACGEAARNVGAPIPVTTKTATTSPAAQPAPTPGSQARIDSTAVNAAMQRVDPSARLGALVIDRETNAQLLSYNAGEQFSSASLVKLLIAIDVVGQGADPGERERIARMLQLSDDTIASEFWVAGGGTEIVRRSSQLIGLTGTAPPERPGQWGDTQLTANDVALIYQYLLGMPDADRELILSSLERVSRVAADGWDQFFGIPDGIGAPFGVKQGWGSNRVNKVVHSTGLVGEDRRYIVVLLTRHVLGVPWNQATESITAAAASFRDLV